MCVITSSHTPGKDSKGAEETSKNSKDSKGKEPGKDAWPGYVLYLPAAVDNFKMCRICMTLYIYIYTCMHVCALFAISVRTLFFDHHPYKVGPLRWLS